MNVIDNITAGVYPAGSQAAAQKDDPKSTESSKDAPKRSDTATETASGEAKADSVEISKNRADNVQFIQAVPENETEAAALLTDIQRQIQQEEQEQLEQAHNIRPESIVGVLS